MKDAEDLFLELPLTERVLLSQEMQLAMDKMREAISCQDEELERLRKERKEFQLKEDEMTRAAEKYEQTILNELQREYQNLTRALNKSYKTASLAKYE